MMLRPDSSPTPRPRGVRVFLFVSPLKTGSRQGGPPLAETLKINQKSRVELQSSGPSEYHGTERGPLDGRLCEAKQDGLRRPRLAGLSTPRLFSLASLLLSSVNFYLAIF